MYSDSLYIDSLLDASWALRYDDIPKSITLSKTGHEMAVAIGDSALQAKALSGLGVALKNAGVYDKAMEYHSASLEIRRALNDSNGVANNYNNIGVVNKLQNWPEKAMEAFRIVEDIREARKDTIDLIQIWMNIGNVLQDMGRFDDAVIKHRKALQYAIRFDQEREIRDNLTNIGYGFYETGMADSAAKYYSLLLSRIDPDEDPGDYAAVLNNFGALTLEDFDSPRLALNKYLLPAFEIAREIGSIGFQKEVHWNLSLTYDKLGDYKKALAHNNRYYEIKDSLFSEEQAARLAALQTIHEVKEKELANQLLSLENEKRVKERNALFVSLIAFFVFVLIIGFYLRYRVRVNRKLAHQSAEIEKQGMVELMRNQESSSMTAMLELQDKERKRIAADLHDRLGSMLAAVKLNFSSMEDSIAEEKSESFGQALDLLDQSYTEVRQISHDMDFGVLAQFGLVAALQDLCHTIASSDAFAVEFEAQSLDHRLDSRVELILYRIIQELLTNIIKHAEAKHISIQLIQHDEELSIMVEDDGRGFDFAKAKRGMGLENIELRVGQLNGNIRVDSMPEKGTTVIIEIPMGE